VSCHNKREAATSLHPLKKKKKTTYALKHIVVCVHSPGHIHINDVPDGLQGWNCDIIWYDPRIGLHPDPPLVGRDENPMKLIVFLSSKRQR